MSSSLFALMDVDNFYASCERLFRPDLIGLPLVVLSNNDGCVIARSNEVKALGVPMGAPYFKIKSLCQQHAVQVFSSNYVLYGDLSRRVMQVTAQLWPDMEVYSIDEAFLDLSGCAGDAALPLCQSVASAVRQQVGIPVSIGLGPTKTLAKLASHVAKKVIKQPVCDLSEPFYRQRFLAKVRVEDVWGVGRQWSAQLHALGVHTAYDLAQIDERCLMREFTVMLRRTVRELQGKVCFPLAVAEPRKRIVSSRTFGAYQTQLWPISQALSVYCARACEKLRQQQSCVQRVTVFLQTNPFSQHVLPYSQRMTHELPYPTADTSVVIACAKQILRDMFRLGYSYHKVGVVLEKISDVNSQQDDLFNSVVAQKHRVCMMEVLDAVNQRYGRDVLRFAAQAGDGSWQVRSQFRSPAYTTRWDELPQVR